MVHGVLGYSLQSYDSRSIINGSGWQLQWCLASGTYIVMEFTSSLYLQFLSEIINCTKFEDHFDCIFKRNIYQEICLVVQMTAEFQVPSPLVPTRESYFVRYCKQHGDGTWAVVDVSLDNLRPSPSVRCRRRPSGCLIHEMPNGYSKV